VRSPFLIFHHDKEKTATDVLGNAWGARQFCKNIAIRLGVIKKLKKSDLLSKGKAFPFSLLACMPNCCLLPDELLPKAGLLRPSQPFALFGSLQR
jgi:hypothetical protein